VDDEGKPTGTMVGHKLSTLRKAQYATDIFTTEGEARARSMDMGLEGVIHVSEYDGQAVYMPAESHEDYLGYYRGEGEQEDPSVDRLEALRAIVQEVLKSDFSKADYQGEKVTLNKPRRTKDGNKKFEVFVQDGEKVKRVTFGDPNMEIRRDDAKARANFRARHSCDTKNDKTSAGYWSCRMWEADTSVSDMTKSNSDAVKILKIDEEQRIIYGWASVTTYKGELIVDLQGDVIKTETLHKAFNEFMKGVRVGKINHSGEQVGQIVHSFPMSKDICEALGIQSDKEGVISGFHVTDDDLWNKVKSGEYAEFSIGGRAQKEEF